VTSLNSFDTCTVDSDCSVTSHCRDVPATACDSDYDCDPSNGNPPLGDVCVGDGNGTCDNTQAGFCEDNGLCVFQGACTDPTNLGTICSPAWPALIEQCAGATTTGLPVQPPWLPDWPVAAACSGNATCTGACLEANSPADKACADCYGATTGITGTACVLAPGNGQWCFPVGLGGTCGPGCPACEKCITGHGIYRDQFVCTGDTTAGCL
jgi:hypothetical protein